VLPSNALDIALSSAIKIRIYDRTPSAAPILFFIMGLIPFRWIPLQPAEGLTAVFSQIEEEIASYTMSID
jgi:hypothetical protein